MERRVSVGAARVGRGSQGEQSGNNLDGELKMFEKDFFGESADAKIMCMSGKKRKYFWFFCSAGNVQEVPTSVGTNLERRSHIRNTHNAIVVVVNF